MRSSEMSDAQRRRAAARIRRLLGAREVDRLVGAAHRRAAVDVLLANSPDRARTSVPDCRDFVSARRLDHPAGFRTARLTTLLSRLSWMSFAAFCLAIVGAFVLGMVASSEEGADPDPFVALGDLTGDGGRLVALVVMVPFGVALMARWMLSSMDPVIALSDARYAVRWAGGRPGQLARGLPVVEPFSGFAKQLRVPAVLLWIVAGGVFLFALWLPTYDEGPPWHLHLAAAGLAVLGALPALGSRQLARMGVVAQDHLTVLTGRSRGLRVDAATAVQEQFLQVALGTKSSRASLGSFASVRERTAYPLTSALDEAELRRRHEHATSVLDNATVVSPPGQAPLVVVEKPGEHGGLSGRFDAEYSAGWLVGEVRDDDSGAKVLLLVRDRPERLRAEVLPAFGQYLNFDPSTLVLLDPPEQLPAGSSWMEGWVKEKSAQRR